MNGNEGYAVFFFPEALTALGEPIKPYLVQSEGKEPHILCREIDTAGALMELTLEGIAPDGKTVQIELMIPGSMVKMIVSARSDGNIGFSPRTKVVGA